MIILSKTNNPFATEQAAKIQASRLGLEGFTIVAVEGGYAIDKEEIAMTEGAEATETVSNATVTETPVKKKHTVTSPWKPASYIHIPEHLKVPGRRYRFCHKDRPGNIDKKQAEGWTIDTELTKQMGKRTPTIQDGKSLDSTLQVRELVVMWMPEEVAKGRDKYYSDKAGAAQKSAREKYKQETSEGGSYGDVTETRG